MEGGPGRVDRYFVLDIGLDRQNRRAAGWARPNVLGFHELQKVIPALFVPEIQEDSGSEFAHWVRPLAEQEAGKVTDPLIDTLGIRANILENAVHLAKLRQQSVAGEFADAEVATGKRGQVRFP
jgi:hypothetical protein